MMPQPPPKTRYVPHKLLKEVIGYLSVGDSDVVIEVHADINKVTRLVDAENNPMLGPDGLPSYSVNWNVRMVMLSAEEWRVKKALTEDDGR